MKKLLFYLFFIICLPIYADNYKILQINSNSIQIGNTMCKQGDTFNDEDPIIWTAEKQAIKAMNLRTGQIRIFVGEAFKKAEAKSIKDFFLRSNHLSTRGGLATFSDLKEELSDTLYVYGTLPIESPFLIDSLSSYVISYGDTPKKWRTLMSTDESFFLSTDLFDPSDFNHVLKLSLYFRRNSDNYLILDDLNIILLPQQIDE